MEDFIFFLEQMFSVLKAVYEIAFGAMCSPAALETLSHIQQ